MQVEQLQSRLRAEDIPPLNIQMLEWRNRVHRGLRILRYDFPATYRVVGIRYAGKGALDECIATKILSQGGTVLDWMGSRASKEGLAWLDSAYAKDVALVVGSNATLRTNIPWYRFTDWQVKDIPKHKIFVMLEHFFQTEEDYYYALLKLMQKIQGRDEWTEGAPDAILIREAQRYLKAASAISTNRNEKIAEQEFIEMHDEAVHSGFSVIVDSKTINTINKNIRDTSNYNFYKNMGAEDLPDSMHHLFNEYTSDMFRSLSPWEFILHTSWNAVGMGVNEYPPFHVVRGKSLLKKFDLTEIQFNGPGVKVEQVQIGRPHIRKVTKEIHDLIIANKQKGRTFVQSMADIYTTFNVSLSKQGTYIESKKHEAGICGFCQEKKEAAE